MKKSAILCVDDEKIVLDSLREQLRKYFKDSHHLESAESVQEALEVIDEMENSGISLIVIVSDWLMPGVKGDEFLIQLHGKYPDITKILLTGQADPDAIKRAEENIDLYSLIHKPWNELELIEAVKKGIEP